MKQLATMAGTGSNIKNVCDLDLPISILIKYNGIVCVLESHNKLGESFINFYLKK